MRNLMIGMLMIAACAGLYVNAACACENCPFPNLCTAESKTATPPAGCSLSAGEFSTRLTEIGGVFAKRQKVNELDDGYAFQFPGDDADLTAKLTTWVVSERQCCSFLRFELTFAPQQGPIWLSVRGSQEFKAMVSSMMAEKE